MAAGVGGDQLGPCPRILAAIQGAQGICLAQGLAVIVIGKKTTDVGQLATCAATDTLALAALIDRQNTRERPPQFGRPRICRIFLYFSYCHVVEDNNSGRFDSCNNQTAKNV